ncbi:MAG: CocE/NonD family hydrolase [Blastocatellales bacterium]
MPNALKEKFLPAGLTLLAALTALINAQEQPVRWRFNAPMPMRDGVILAANVYLPKAEGKYPAILIRTPYGKSGEHDNALFYAERGYVVVAQDTRGRYDSDGEWYAFRNEAADGFDSIEWAARQPWSNGKVVTMGASYLGMDQWLAATGLNPHLAAMVVRVSPADLYSEVAHPGGSLGTVVWSVAMGRRNLLRRELSLIPWDKVFRYLPVEEAAATAGTDSPFLRDWINHPARDEYWQAMSWRHIYSKLNVPVFHSGGWFDTFQKGTIENFQRMISEAPAGARRAQRLVIGPWVHGDLGGPSPGAKERFGPQSVMELRAKELRWLDHYVRGVQNGADAEPQVDYFVMGANQWKSERAWPPANSTPTRYYLHSQGKANTSDGDGVLSLGVPEDEPADHFEYDPANPVPTDGEGKCCSENIPAGPRDQRNVERRKDVLVYSTPPLEKSVEVSGPIKVYLYAATSARDTDWTAKLVDVSPDGFAMNLTDGLLRARYRQSFEKQELLEPGRVYEFAIDLGHTSNVFLQGHRIRLEISSSNFPRHSRNTNTGNNPEKDTNFIVARQTIFHSRERPSFLVLPVKTSSSAKP